MSPLPSALALPGSSPLGLLLVLAIVGPLCGLAPLLLLKARAAERSALFFLAAGLAVVIAICAEVAWGGRPLAYFLGGFRPPLGVGLRADGLSIFMLGVSALVIVAAGLFAMTAPGAQKPRMPLAFWMLLLSVWSALNLVYLADDLFALYVALELLTFAAVPLVCLDGRAKTLAAALQYLLFALFGSVLYLLGTALIYGTYGTLDIILLAQRAQGEPALLVALALMTAGMAAKAALFPLYLWLPAAHAGAPAAASAILSAVVIKAPIFLIVRFWYDIATPAQNAAAAPVLSALGAGAVVLCGVFALRQTRLKLLIAYSTAAQIGYLFLMFPLAAATAGASVWSAIAWTGGALHLVSHALSKAAMFMAAGVIAETLGHDRISGLSGIGRIVPISVFAFGLGGLSLMGLPPSGGFVAKVMLLTSAVQQGAWWIAGVILVGGLLAAGYVLRVVLPALSRPEDGLVTVPVSRWREMVALVLALGAVALGLVPLQPAAFLAIGRPASWAGAAP
ncbi:proton-conducting transporter membrane subunit [Xanthobacter sp. DSM 24535]|uniref:complex I subunit 5 family protein n=1 Tax=Roseixanthobacter psychrophilus TaxID=3119917 RepID=UPI003727E822